MAENATQVQELSKELFENDGGWLVTSYEGNGYKIGKVADIDSNETPIDCVFVESKDNDTPNTTAELGKLPKFFIADLFRAEKRGNCFVHKNVVFKRVLIHGTIVSVYPHKDKCALVVDDGTGNITCFLEHSQHVEDLKKAVEDDKEQVEKLLLAEPENPLLRASCMMASLSFRRMQKVPLAKDLAKGDSVTLIGKFSQYLQYRNIYVHRLVKHQDSERDHEHLKEVFNLYSNNIYDIAKP